MRRETTAALGGWVALFLASCASEPPPVPHEFTVGVHRASVASHDPWQHVDQGRRHLLRLGEVQLSVDDLGPVGQLGIRHEVERARDLWLAGKAEEARTLMRMIPVSPEHFATPDHRTAFWETWREVTSAPDYLDSTAVRMRFRPLFDAIESLQPRTTDDLIESALKVLDHDHRRSIAMTVRSTIDGREAVLVETWNRLSHTDPKRFAFVFDDGYLLVLRTERGPWVEASRAFDQAFETLRIAPRSGAQSTGGVRSSSA